jgi:hypothetical protein
LMMKRVMRSHLRQQQHCSWKSRRWRRPCQTSKMQGRSTSSTDLAGDLGSNKRMKKAPPKPCKPGLRSATK